MEKIIKKLEEHDQRFDKHDQRFDKHDAKFDKVFKTLEEHTIQIDLIARTVAEHTERFDKLLETMATKDDIERIMGALDGVMGLVKKHDEEIVVLNHNVRRIDRRVEVLEVKI